MQKLFTLLLVVVIIVPASTASARSVKTSHLDDDPVRRIPVPVLFMELSDITPDFGAPRGGGTRSHEGQDFLAPEGAPIVSPTEAVVLDLGTWSGGGRYVQTVNPGGERFRYMHLDEWADIERGDRLDVGDYIGTVGDTGNAPDGVYHLHFETLDEDGEPLDPYDRLIEAFDLEDQMDFLDDVFKNRHDDSDYAEFLVEAFPDTFRRALAEDIDLPRAIDRALDDTDIADSIEEIESLTTLIESIPSLLPAGIGTGDQGALVALLQIYLIYGSDGPARDRLAAAGPTGYYGGITAAAVQELQDAERAEESGVYDTKTQRVFAGRKLTGLNL